MGKPAHPQREEALRAIREHILDVGPDDLSEVRKRYPTVSSATFSGWVKEIRAKFEGQLPRRVEQAADKIRKFTTETAIGNNLPRAPAPGPFQQLGRAGDEAFDFLGMFQEIVADAGHLRDATMKRNPDGTMRVLNPNMLDRNLQRRLQILETWMTAKGMIYNIETLERLYKTVIEEIGKEDINVQARILNRLQDLNKTHGLNISGAF